MAHPREHRSPEPRRGALRTLGRIAAAALALAVLAAGALLVRLWLGPVSLDFLTPRIVAALEPEDGSYRVRVGATRLVWAGRGRGIDLTANEVSCTDAAGAPVASLREVAIHLSIPALLRGEVAPRQIDLFSPDLRLVREADGSIGLGLGRSASETGGTSILDAFAAGADEAGGETPAAAWLRRVRVRDGRLALTDRASGFETTAVDVNADVRRADDSVGIDLSGELALGERRFPVRVHATRPEPAAPTQIGFSFRELDPSALVEGAAALVAAAGPDAGSVADAIARLRMPLDLDVDLELVRAAWSTLRVRARGKSGALELAPLLPQAVALAELGLEASMSASPERAAVDLSLDLGGPALQVAAAWEGAATASGEIAGGAARSAAGARASEGAADDAAPESAAGDLTVQATVKQLPASSIERYWPASAAEEARAWVTQNIRDGAVRAASASFTGTASLGDAPGLALKKLAGRVEFAGLTVRYVDTMPPAKGVSGSAEFSADAWKFAVRSGSVAGLAVPSAAVDLTALASDVPRIAIDARAKGPLRDALLLVDHEPLRYARRAGIDPAGAAGTIDGRLQLAFPLAGAPVPPDLGAVVAVDLRGAKLRDVAGDRSLTDGNLRLDVRASTLTLSGNARFANAPCEVKWKEQLAATHGITRVVDVRATVDAPERAALGLDLRPWLTGPVGVTAHLEQAKDETGSAKVVVDLAPAQVAAPELRLTKPRGAPGRASGTLRLAGGHIVAIDAFQLDAAGGDARGRATLSGGHFAAIDLAGELPAGKRGGARPDFSLTAAPARDPTEHRLVFTSEDASALLRLILPDATVSGGALRFAGHTSHERPGLDLTGSFTIEKFTLTESSLLTRLLTLASLPGIVSALRSEGVAFDRLSSDVAYAAEVTTFEHAVLTGPSLRLLFGGTVDGARDRIAIDGTLVPPLYGLNTLPGKIPVLGRLFGGDDGELLGIDFSVRGELEDPKISMKPLSTLTPSVLKSLTGASSRH